MKKNYMILATLVFLCGILSAQEEAFRAQVMVLGSYHMHNPGADVFNLEADDVLTSRRQAEISEVVRQLRAFDPTMIALEIFRGSERDTATQDDFLHFTKGEFELTRWEGHQIGFRLAKEMGHQRIYNIDEPGRFPFQEMLDYAKANGQAAWLDQEMAKMQRKMDEEDESMRRQSISVQLANLNRPNELQKGHSIYVAGCQIGAGNDFPGTNVLAEWYTRNARIFTNLYRITEGKKNEKILVIFGAGHAYLLRDLINTALEFQLIEPNVFLQQDTFLFSKELLQRHLKAVVEKDSLTLKSTIKMGAAYKLILPDGSSMETAQAFYHMHMEWFKEPNWTMEMKILEFSEKGDLATAVVVADYREPDRNGKPYHHKMWITYILEQVEGKWFVVHDHASTAEKTE